MRGKIIAEYKEDNMMLAPIYGMNNKSEGALALGFFDVSIKNLTNIAKTIKNINLKYKFEKREYVTNSFVLFTGGNRNYQRDIKIPNINGQDTIILVECKNLMTKLSNFEPLAPEGMVNGFILFIFYNCKMIDYKKISNIEMLITDTRNKVYKKKIELTDRNLTGYFHGYYFRTWYKNEY